MGQKVNPINLRIGYYKNWKSNWFSDKFTNYSDLLHEDLTISKYVENIFKKDKLLVDSPKISRSQDNLIVNSNIFNYSNPKLLPTKVFEGGFNVNKIDNNRFIGYSINSQETNNTRTLKVIANEVINKTENVNNYEKRVFLVNKNKKFTDARNKLKVSKVYIPQIKSKIN